MQIFSVINLSAESPQTDSVILNSQAVLKKIYNLLDYGANYIDLGGRSSGSKTQMISDELEILRLDSIFNILPEKLKPFISLDTWSVKTALKFLPKISVLNYTSTYFPEVLIDALVNNKCKIILNYLPADNPYVLRDIPYKEPDIRDIENYFYEAVPFLQNKGVEIMAIDPNLGMWHPDTPAELKAEIPKKIIANISNFKKIAPVFVISPRDIYKKLNVQLVKQIFSQNVDYIRTHDLEKIIKYNTTMFTLGE